MPRSASPSTYPDPSSGRSTRKVVYAALIGNLLVAITTFGAAYFTGNSATVSEANHSLVDTSNEGLLLYGLRRAARPADPRHPFGHGRELYFWSFIVALLIFALGAGVSVYQGVLRIMHPVEIADDLTAGQVEELVAELEARVRDVHPEVVSILLKPQSVEAFESSRERRFGRHRRSA